MAVARRAADGDWATAFAPRCRSCGWRFNERTSTPFNYLEVTTDVVLLIVRWRLRYKLSLRDLAEMFFLGYIYIEAIRRAQTFINTRR